MQTWPLFEYVKLNCDYFSVHAKTIFLVIHTLAHKPSMKERMIPDTLVHFATQ